MKENINKRYYSIKNNNYLLNSYKHIINSNILHFIITLIEIFFTILQELYIIIDKYNFDSKFKNEFVNFILLIRNKINTLPIIINFVIILVYTIIFDLLFIFLTLKKFNKKYTSISYLYNFLEFLYFRILFLVYLNLVFSFKDIYLIILCVLLIPHAYLTISHLLYNHLYYFVPIFIEYPYDEFSSLFDLISLFIKLLISITVNTNRIFIRNCFHIFLFLVQIYFSLFFIKKLINHSYLFMKNNFINKVKVSLFFVQTFCLIIAELIRKKDIISIFFLIVNIGLIIFLLLFVNIIYEPKSYIYIRNETPNENMFFYLYILSEKNEINFLFESKINEHYEICGVCSLCNKYRKYLCGFEETKENEQIKLINSDKEQKDKLIDIFHIIYDDKNNYFKLINKIVLYYKYNRKKYLINSSYYYINLSFLIYSEFKTDNITLALNIKILLDIINKENKYIDCKDLEIEQIMFCNKFLSLSNDILTKLKDILILEYSSAKKLIDLSVLLKEMQKPKYKDVLYNYKQDNSSNSKNIIMICSILYEEIFNITINTSQIPIRDNHQILEDIFFNNINRTNKIITLAINLINNDCKIVRAGKGLHQYKDNNLFDLFPLIFKDHQMKLFLTKIFENYNIDNKNYNDFLCSDSLISINKNELGKNLQIKKKHKLKFFKDNNKKSKRKSQNVEIKLIICENISSKLYYKLLILKLSPLFNYDFNSYYLLFDGTFYLYKNSIMTLTDFENNKIEKVISVSKPEIEEPPTIYSMKYHKYSIWLEKNGFLSNKIFEQYLSNKLYIIYSIVPKDKENNNLKIQGKIFYQRESIPDIELSDTKKNLIMNKQYQNIIEENSSVASQQTSNNYTIGLTGYSLKTKKKENMYRYSNLYILKNTLIFSIPAILLIFILEIIHLNSLRDAIINNDYSILKFDEIYKLYFQLFSSTLSTACIGKKDHCVSIASLFIIDQEGLNSFNFSSFLLAQNNLLTEELLLKKNNLLNIHNNIGNEKYKEIFEEKVDYIRISKTFIKGKIRLSLSNITMPFSEAILKICNSFQIIVNHTKNENIYILNKKIDPLMYLIEDEIQNFSEYQKEISELILNYKIYKNQFININQKFIDILAIQSQNIELYIYLHFNLTLFICIYLLIILYIYLIQFEQIIIKILNYINMIKHFQKEDFNFSSEFIKKIDNLQIIINLYTDNPYKAIHELKELYKKYHKYATNQNSNKNNENHSNKKNLKKINEIENKKDELDMVPVNQRIFNSNDIRKLYIMYYYKLFFILLSSGIIIIYFIIMKIWISYSSVKTSLYSLVSKNLDLEISLYKTINLYHLMIFNNLTIDELAKDIFYAPNENIYNKATLLNSFYGDLFIAFNYEIEITVLRNAFKNFPFFNFSCENLYSLNKQNIFSLTKFYSFKNESEIESQLIKICEFSKVAAYGDMNADFQWHYQNIKNAIVSINDFSYEGLINHLNLGFLGRVQLNFNCILIYLLDIISSKMHKEEIYDLIILLQDNLYTTLIATFLMYFGLIIIIRLVYIRRLKKYCNQILLLKKIFKIYEIQDQ